MKSRLRFFCQGVKKVNYDSKMWFHQGTHISPDTDPNYIHIIANNQTNENLIKYFLSLKNTIVKLVIFVWTDGLMKTLSLMLLMMVQQGKELCKFPTK